MRRVLMTILAAVALAVACRAANGFGGEQRGRPIPYRVIPFEQLGVSVNNWTDTSNAKFSIIGSPAEWRMAFSPNGSLGNKQPPAPNAAFFEREQLVAVSRESAAPASGQPILVPRSLELLDNELVFTYSFIPPQMNTGHRVKATLLLAIPVEHQSNIRFLEEIETPTTLATEAELDAAKAAGRYKPHALGQ